MSLWKTITYSVVLVLGFGIGFIVCDYSNTINQKMYFNGRPFYIRIPQSDRIFMIRKEEDSLMQNCNFLFSLVRASGTMVIENLSTMGIHLGEGGFVGVKAANGVQSRISFAITCEEGNHLRLIPFLIPR